MNGDGVPAPGLLDQNQQDFTTQIARALGVQGVVPGKLDPLVGVGIQLDDFRALEYQFLRRTTCAYFGSQAAAVAAQFGFSSIRGGNGTLTVIDKIIIANTSAATLAFDCGIQGQFPSGVGNLPGTARDTRFGVAVLNTLSVVRAGSDAAPVLPSIPYQISVPAGGSFEWDPGVVLSSASAFFSVVAKTVNLGFSVAWFWRERPMLNTEGL